MNQIGVLFSEEELRYLQTLMDYCRDKKAEVIGGKVDEAIRFLEQHTGYIIEGRQVGECVSLCKT